jgi:Kef-type K+ transport system membrane component KefB
VVVAVGGTLVTDTLALTVLAVVLGIAAAGSPDGAGAVRALQPVLLLGVLATVTFLLLPRLSRAFFRRDHISRAEKALFVLAALMLLATAAELVGTDVILGAFIAGVAMNEALAEREELKEHIEFVGRMLFLPFFFIWTGTLLEIEVLTGSTQAWLYAGALLAFIVVGKLSASWIIGAVNGYTVMDRLLMTSLTMPQAAATLAVTLTARQAGLFEAELVDAVILVIFITCLLGPVLTDRTGRRLVRSAAETADDAAMHEPVQHRDDD